MSKIRVGLSALAILLVASCGGTEATKASSTPTKTVTVTPSTAPLEVEPETPEPEPTDDEAEDSGVSTFGGPGFDYEDGVTVKVSKAKSYQPDLETAAFRKGDKHFVVFTITIINGTKKVLDPSEISVTGQTGNREAEECYDGDIGGTPETKVLPGKNVAFKNVYGIDKGKDFVMEITPGYDYESSLFAS